MNKQNTETETTRNETLKKWTLETLCNIAILVSGHPEIEDDFLDKLCEDLETEELALHTYLKSLHPEPEAPLYAVDVVEVDTKDVITTSYFTHKASAYEYLEKMEDKIQNMGCVGVVRPIPEAKVDKLLS